jgi:HPt (histidine-containing phosphotransfer) domain-containing protein
MPDKAIDLATFEELKLVSGADFIGELIDTLLEDGPKLIGELKSALKAGDAAAFRRAAHSLKSNGATFGAGHFSQLARDLEVIGKEERLGDAGDRIQVLETAFAMVAEELKGLRG